MLLRKRWHALSNVTTAPAKEPKMDDDSKAPFYAAKMRLSLEDANPLMIVEIKETRRSPWKRIAQRDSGEQWTMLEPGWTVHGSEPGTDYNKLEIEYNPEAAEPH